MEISCSSAIRFNGGNVIVIVAVHSRFPGASLGIPHFLKRVDNHQLCFWKSSKKLMISSSSPFPIKPQVTDKWKLRFESSVKSKSRSLIRLSVSSKQRYSTSQCMVGIPQTGSPCDTCKPSHSISQLLPILAAPLRTFTPCGISPSNRYTYSTHRCDSRVSASTVTNFLFITTSFRFCLWTV